MRAWARDIAKWKRQRRTAIRLFRQRSKKRRAEGCQAVDGAGWRGCAVKYATCIGEPGAAKARLNYRNQAPLIRVGSKAISARSPGFAHRAKEPANVHPDRAHPKSGHAEVPARPRRAPDRHTRHARQGRRRASRRSPSGCSTSPASPACSSAPTSSRSPRPTANGSNSSLRSSAPSWSTSCRARRCCAASTASAAGGADEFFAAEDAETVATIKELIETRVRPAVANDGGDITFRGFKDGIVFLDMKGACSGCPSSTATLRHGIQNLLKPLRPRRRRGAADVSRNREADSGSDRELQASRLHCWHSCSLLRHSLYSDSHWSAGDHARPCHRYRARSLLGGRARHRRGGVIASETSPWCAAMPKR